MEERKRMSLDDLHLTAEYFRLTQKQKMFVDTYVASGVLDGNYDAVTATNIAYPCKSEEVARVMSYELLGNINILAALNRHFGNDDIDAFLVVLDRAIRNKKISTAQLGALRLRCEVLGIKTRIPASPEKRWVLPAPNRDAKQKTPKRPKKSAETPASPRPNDYDLSGLD